jgi:hypothetical protein
MARQPLASCQFRSDRRDTAAVDPRRLRCIIETDVTRFFRELPTNGLSISDKAE